MYFQTKHSASSLRKSLNLIVLGISFGMAFFTVVGTPLGGAPFTGFIRALGASDLTYSIIMALPVFGGILQVLASYFIESTGKRRPVFLISGFIHRLLWIPIALIPLFVPLENKGFLIWTITALIAISFLAEEP